MQGKILAFLARFGKAAGIAITENTQAFRFGNSLKNLKKSETSSN